MTKMKNVYLLTEQDMTQTMITQMSWEKTTCSNCIIKCKSFRLQQRLRKCGEYAFLVNHKINKTQTGYNQINNSLIVCKWNLTLKTLNLLQYLKVHSMHTKI